jgi:L-threonylcarbamoyladenylate synthase
MKKSHIQKIDSSRPDESIILKAARIIIHGGIVAYPTETFYGLGADAFNIWAIEKVYQIKRRDLSKPILVIVEKEEHLRELVGDIPPLAAALMREFWPGPLTIIFRASTKIPTVLTGDTGKVGIRISSHAVASGLLRAVGRPITATSANISGQPESVNASDVLRNFEDKLDLVLDGGRTQAVKGSTIVDVTIDPPRIIREGLIPSGDLKPYLHSISPH